MIDNNKERSTSKNINFLAKILRFLCSQVGTFCMVIIYCFVGGLVFENLEKHNEKDSCFEARAEYLPIVEQTITNLIKITQKYPNTKDQFQHISKIIDRFRNNTLMIGYDGRNCSRYGQKGGPAYEWSLTGSIFFSITVITTIGYGHIAPRTFWGRLVFIAYAILGIPLMLMGLTNLGNILASYFRHLYAKLCCCGCLHQQSPLNDQVHFDVNSVKVPLAVSFFAICVYLFGGTLLFTLWEGWDWLQSAYFCFTTLSTIGFGDVVPSSGGSLTTQYFKLIVGGVYVLVGLGLVAMCFSLMQDQIVSKFVWVAVFLGIVEKGEAAEEMFRCNKGSQTSLKEPTEPGTSQSDTLMPGPSPIDTLKPGPSQCDTLKPGPSQCDTLKSGRSPSDTWKPGPSPSDTWKPGRAPSDTWKPGPSPSDTWKPGPSPSHTWKPRPSPSHSLKPDHNDT